MESGNQPKGVLAKFSQEKNAPKTVESCKTKIIKLKKDIAEK